MSSVTVQPAPFTDHVTEDGTELTRLPYPYHVTEEGAVLRQDFWRGDPELVIGFQARLDEQRIDLWWKDAWLEPEKAVGMYVVLCDSEGKWSTVQTAIQSVEKS